MTANTIKKFLFFSVYAVICVIVILLQSSGILTLNIYTASTVLMLPLTVYIGFYFGGLTGAVFGFVSGILLDVFSSTLCYNTVCMTLIGFVCGMLMNYLFNRNLAAAIVMNFSAAIIYFVVKWLIFYAFFDPLPSFVLLRYTLPSAIYTAVCGIVIYFIIFPILKRMDLAKK
jgi:rod shape-determining protein MreD